MTKLIALSGRKQSGKSTGGESLCAFLAKHNPLLKTKIYSFADPLKIDICMNILGLTHEQCYGSDDDKNTLTDLNWGGSAITAREAMEIIGTEIFRKLKTSVWVDATISKIMKEKYDVAVIVDCRFPNESDEVLRKDGYVIRLNLDPFHSVSLSESALDQTNYDWNKFTTIINNQHMSIEEKDQALFRFIKDIQLI
jgi:hypothetical protein